MNKKVVFVCLILGALSWSCGDSEETGQTVDATCSVVTNDDGSTSLACPDGTKTDLGGGETPEDQQCTIADGAEAGTKVITCADGTSATITPDTDTDTSCTVEDGQDGAKTVTCEDGTSVTIAPAPAATTQTVRGTIAAGGSLTLTHGLNDAALSATYIEDGQVRDIADFAQRHSAVVGTPVSNFSASSLTRVDGQRLSNGDILLFGGDWYGVYKTDGTAVVDQASLPGDACEAAADALETGGFLLSYRQPCYDSDAPVLVRRFDDSGTDVGFNNGAVAQVELAPPAGAGSSAGLKVCTRADGSFAVAEEVDRLRITNFDVDGNQVARVYDAQRNGLDDEIEVSCLPNGGFLLVSQFDDLAGDSTIRATAIDAAGTVVSEAMLGGTYLGDDLSLAEAPNGNVVVAYELGGPDAMAYAAFDDTGALISGPTTLAGVEPDEYSVGVYPDGDFVVTMVEDDTSAGMMWNVKNDGTLQHAAPIFFGEGFEPDYRIAVVPGDNPHEVIMLYDVYSDPSSYMASISKNVLTLSETSDTEAVVTNMTQYDVEVVISAVGTRE